MAQAVLGHSQVGTTVDTYGHLNAVYLAHQMDLANGTGATDRQSPRFVDPLVKRELTNPALHGAAILNWALDGWRLYREEGLGEGFAPKDAWRLFA